MFKQHFNITPVFKTLFTSPALFMHLLLFMHNDGAKQATLGNYFHNQGATVGKALSLVITKVQLDDNSI